MSDEPAVVVVPGDRGRARSQMIQHGPSDDPDVVVVPGDLHLTEPGLENHRVAVDELVGSCWSAPLHVDRLSKGEHTLAVEVCDEEDCRDIRSIRFVVDPTGRYTAVPRVELRVEETAFC
jgi:hypothetical protein